jgi:NADH-quinone oxidoreductase subunit L
VVGGFAKIPEFIASFKPFEDFLGPVFSSEATQRVMESGIHNHGIEAMFAGFAFVMVVVGWYSADLMYRQHKIDPERFSSMFGGAAYDLVYNKYYIDEIYQALVIQPYIALCFAFAWFDRNIIDGIVNLAARIAVLASWFSGLIDTYIVDGLVNLASNETLAIGGRLRRLQTGSINGYLYGILAGVMIILLVRAMLHV